MKGARHCMHAISQSCCCCCLSCHDWQHPVQPDNTSNLNIWRFDQHLLQRVWKPTNTEDSTNIKPHKYWFQCTRFDFLATMLLETRVFWDMTLCHLEVVPGVSNNHSSFTFPLSSGLSSLDCTTNFRYLKPTYPAIHFTSQNTSIFLIRSALSYLHLM